MLPFFVKIFQKVLSYIHHHPIYIFLRIITQVRYTRVVMKSTTNVVTNFDAENIRRHGITTVMVQATSIVDSP